MSDSKSKRGIVGRALHGAPIGALIGAGCGVVGVLGTIIGGIFEAFGVTGGGGIPGAIFSAFDTSPPKGGEILGAIIGATVFGAIIGAIFGAIGGKRGYAIVDALSSKRGYAIVDAVGYVIVGGSFGVIVGAILDTIIGAIIGTTPDSKRAIIAVTVVLGAIIGAVVQRIKASNRT